MNLPKLSNGIFHTTPADLISAFGAPGPAIDAWEDLSSIARNEFICWIEEAKQASTRAHRIERTVEDLLAGQRRPCCWMGCIHRIDKAPSQWQQDVMIDKKPLER